MTNVPFLNSITNEMQKRKLKSDVVANALLDISIGNEKLDDVLSIQSSASEIDGLVQKNNLFNARLATSRINPNIVCYGDSNTRYYQGDVYISGPYSKAYGAFLDLFLTNEPSLYGATVSIKGFPGETVAYGDNNFTLNVPANTNILVIGFGTNDIKFANSNLNNYIQSLINIIDKAHVLGIHVMVLSIPWFAETYAEDGATGQLRLPIWNKEIEKLCNFKSCSYIDTYSFTSNAPNRYFNEITTYKRHYNTVATRLIATKIISEIKKINLNYETSKFRINTFNDLSFISSSVGIITRELYQIGGMAFETLKIPAGASITIKGKSHGCACFYPRSSAVATISTAGETVTKTIGNTVDAGQYYSASRLAFASPYTEYESNPSFDIVITAISGTLYLREISIVEGLYKA